MKKLDILNALKAKREPYHVPGTEIDLILRSLTFTELSKYGELAEQKDTKGAIEYTIFTVFRENLPTKEMNSEEGFTDEEIHAFIPQLDAKIVTDILKRVQILSGLIKDEEKEKNLMGTQEANKELTA